MDEVESYELESSNVLMYFSTFSCFCYLYILLHLYLFCYLFVSYYLCKFCFFFFPFLDLAPKPIMSTDRDKLRISSWGGWR